MQVEHKWHSFEEARQFARTLGLKNEDEWQEYCKSGQKPDDIPVNPSRIYSEEWKGYTHWLGAETSSEFEQVPGRAQRFTENDEAVKEDAKDTTGTTEDATEDTKDTEMQN